MYNQCLNFQYKSVVWILGYMRWLQLFNVHKLGGIRYLKIRFHNSFLSFATITSDWISSIHLIIDSLTPYYAIYNSHACVINDRIILWLNKFFVTRKSNNPNALILSVIKHDYSTSTPFYSKISALILNILCIINILNNHFYFGAVFFPKIFCPDLVSNFCMS